MPNTKKNVVVVDEMKVDFVVAVGIVEKYAEYAQRNKRVRM